MRQLFLSSLCADKKGQSYSLSGNKHLTSQLTPIRCGAHLVLLFTAFIILTEPLSVKQNYFCLHFWNYITQNGIDIYFLLINNHFIIPHDIQSNMPSFDRSSRLKLFFAVIIRRIYQSIPVRYPAPRSSAHAHWDEPRRTNTPKRLWR